MALRSTAALAAVLWTALLATGAEQPLSAIAPLPSGTLLFLENCNSVVEWSTRGSIAHVAVALDQGGETWVYEATPGSVRKVGFSDYCTELARLNQRRSDDERVKLYALRPLPTYTDEEQASMQSFLNEQLGRRYSIKSYVRGKPYDGIHCAELASSTLNRTRRYELSECHKIHPQALFNLVQSTHAPPEEIQLPSLDDKEPWMAWLWRSWSGWTGWCAWSCREAWLFF